MLKTLWRKLFPEKPITLGEVVWVPVFCGGSFDCMVAGVVCRMLHEQYVEVCVMQPPNAPEYRRMRVLTREAERAGAIEPGVAYRMK